MSPAKLKVATFDAARVPTWDATCMNAHFKEDYFPVKVHAGDITYKLLHLH